MCGGANSLADPPRDTSESLLSQSLHLFPLAGTTCAGENNALSVILYRRNTGLARTVRTAEEPRICFDSMSDDLATAVITGWGKTVNCALKAVECVSLAGGNNLESQMVVITTYFALCHIAPPLISTELWCRVAALRSIDLCRRAAIAVDEKINPGAALQFSRFG